MPGEVCFMCGGTGERRSAVAEPCLACGGRGISRARETIRHSDHDPLEIAVAAFQRAYAEQDEHAIFLGAGA